MNAGCLNDPQLSLLGELQVGNFYPDVPRSLVVDDTMDRVLPMFLHI